MQTVPQFIIKLNTHLVYNSATLPLGIYLCENICLEKAYELKICPHKTLYQNVHGSFSRRLKITQMFISDEWMNKQWSSHTTGCYSAKQGTTACKTSKMSVKDIALSERSQMPKSTCNIIPLIGDPGNLNSRQKHISGSQGLGLGLEQGINCKEVKGNVQG